jgi:hypothetical protein
MAVESMMINVISKGIDASPILLTTKDLPPAHAFT